MRAKYLAMSGRYPAFSTGVRNPRRRRLMKEASSAIMRASILLDVRVIFISRSSFSAKDNFRPSLMPNYKSFLQIIHYFWHDSCQKFGIARFAIFLSDKKIIVNIFTEVNTLEFRDQTESWFFQDPGLLSDPGGRKNYFKPPG